MHDNHRVSGAHSFLDRVPKIRWIDHAVRAWQHLVSGLGGKARATLATTVRDNRTSGAGAHAQAETMRLGTTTVIGLKSPLSHDSSPLKQWVFPPFIR